MAFINLTSRAAQERKLAHLIAAAAGDELALPAWADWLEENGSLRVARKVRWCIQMFCQRKEPNLRGETGLVWHARYELALMADSVARKWGYARFGYQGNWNPNGTCVDGDDGSLEWALMGGYIPILDRGNASHEKMARILDACGFVVDWA